MAYIDATGMYCNNKLCQHTQTVSYFNGKVPSDGVCDKCGFKTLKPWPLLPPNFYNEMKAGLLDKAL